MAKSTRPSPPSSVKVNGKPESKDMATKAERSVKVSAVIDDPTAGQQVLLRIQYSSNDFKTHKTVQSGWGKQARRVTLTLSGLKKNTLYKARLWTVAKASTNQISKNYNGISFWTNRKPTIELILPAENAEYEQFDVDGQPTVILFDWKFADPDDPDKQDQRAYRIRYRAVSKGFAGNEPSDKNWKYLPADGAQTGENGKNTFRRVNATTLVANTTYIWSVTGRDPQGDWAEWPLAQSFFIRGVSSPPTLLSPIGGYGTTIIATEPVTFTWRFRDPDPATKQVQADLRWRVVGTGGIGLAGEEGDAGWFTLFGEGVTPGEVMQWEVPSGYFSVGFQYEWQARTYSDKESGVPSGWSQSGKFWATLTPGSGVLVPLMPEETEPLNALGCGHHRAFIYDQGGQRLRGEIKPLARVQWNRRRDDISNAIIDTNGFDQDCCELLGNVTSWAHELVIFRDDVRVFEGPITRITYTSASVEIEAKDVMGYLYRRVMRQGYNDAYRRIDITPKTPAQPVSEGQKGGPYVIIGQNTVVDRALQIALNALAYHDPNVLAYVTAIRWPDDATQNRTVPDLSRSAWEEIDDLAATAGLDYVTVGRRILFWDTHRAIGRLPEMRDGDFSDPVIVTEYGMQTANWYAVTNNNGIAGIAYPLGKDSSNWTDLYGPVEMVSSAWSEQDAPVVDTKQLTPAQRDALVQSLTRQAEKGVADRWPNPVVVRVPDNSTLNPQVNLHINHLIPGVWIPLRATQTCRQLAQWQKLDFVDVEEVEGTEAIRVTMSPAPNGGDDDPDRAGGEDAS